MFNSNTCSNLAHLGDIRLQILSDHDFNLSRPFKVKMLWCHWTLIYGFLLMVKSNMAYLCSFLQNICSFLQNICSFTRYNWFIFEKKLLPHFWLSAPLRDIIALFLRRNFCRIFDKKPYIDIVLFIGVLHNAVLHARRRRRKMATEIPTRDWGQLNPAISLMPSDTDPWASQQ